MVILANNVKIIHKCRDNVFLYYKYLPRITYHCILFLGRYLQILGEFNPHHSYYNELTSGGRQKKTFRRPSTVPLPQKKIFSDKM